MLDTTIAGSLPKPAWRLEGKALERGKRDAVLVWLKEQEDAGVDIVEVNTVDAFDEVMGQAGAIVLQPSSSMDGATKPRSCGAVSVY